eukprot:8355345-Karenia_brevis.AAC.1
MVLQPTIHMLQPNLLRGGPRGANQMLLSETARGLPRFRYLIANIFKKYLRTRPNNVFVREEIEGMNVIVLPQFNIDHFNRESMVLYRDMILNERTVQGVKSKLETKEIVTIKFYWRRFCAWWQRYTLVVLHEGRQNATS